MSVIHEGQQSNEEYEIREWQFDSQVFEFGSDGFLHEVVVASQPETLNKELQEYKQSLWSLKEENTVLKVKLQRLNDTLKKKNQLIDQLYLGPVNKLQAKESMSQFTQRIETLEEENDSLKEDLLQKERTIRQLRKQMNTFVAYKPKLPQTMKKPISLAPSRSGTGTGRSQDCVSCQQGSDNDTERSLLQSEANLTPSTESEHPHKEIAILHTGFRDIIDEVTKLKASVADINQAHLKTVHELQTREKELKARLQDKHEQFKYSVMLKKAIREGDSNGKRFPGGNEGWSTSLRTKTTNEGGRAVSRNSTSNGKSTSKAVSRRAVSAFARIQPVSKNNKAAKKSVVVYKEKKHNPLAIRTCSQNSLLDENDMKLYIDGVLKDMNREDVIKKH